MKKLLLLISLIALPLFAGYNPDIVKLTPDKVTYVYGETVKVTAEFATGNLTFVSADAKIVDDDVNGATIDTGIISSAFTYNWVSNKAGQFKANAKLPNGNWFASISFTIIDLWLEKKSDQGYANGGVDIFPDICLNAQAEYKTTKFIAHVPSGWAAGVTAPTGSNNITMTPADGIVVDGQEVTITGTNTGTYELEITLRVTPFHSNKWSGQGTVFKVIAEITGGNPEFVAGQQKNFSLATLANAALPIIVPSGSDACLAGETTKGTYEINGTNVAPAGAYNVWQEGPLNANGQGLGTISIGCSTGDLESPTDIASQVAGVGVIQDMKVKFTTDPAVSSVTRTKLDIVFKRDVRFSLITLSTDLITALGSMSVGVGIVSFSTTGNGADAVAAGNHEFLFQSPSGTWYDPSGIAASGNLPTGADASVSATTIIPPIVAHNQTNVESISVGNLSVDFGDTAVLRSGLALGVKAENGLIYTGFAQGYAKAYKVIYTISNCTLLTPAP